MRGKRRRGLCGALQQTSNLVPGAGHACEPLERRAMLSAAVSFNLAPEYAAKEGTSSVTSADFNGDGKADLAAARSWYSAVSVLLNDGNGTFAPKVDYAVGSGPSVVS